MNTHTIVINHTMKNQYYFDEFIKNQLMASTLSLLFFLINVEYHLIWT